MKYCSQNWFVVRNYIFTSMYNPQKYFEEDCILSFGGWIVPYPFFHRRIQQILVFWELNAVLLKNHFLLFAIPTTLISKWSRFSNAVYVFNLLQQCTSDQSTKPTEINWEFYIGKEKSLMKIQCFIQIFFESNEIFNSDDPCAVATTLIPFSLMPGKSAWSSGVFPHILSLSQRRWTAFPTLTFSISRALISKRAMHLLSLYWRYQHQPASAKLIVCSELPVWWELHSLLPMTMHQTIWRETLPLLPYHCPEVWAKQYHQWRIFLWSWNRSP